MVKSRVLKGQTGKFPMGGSSIDELRGGRFPIDAFKTGRNSKPPGLLNPMKNSVKPLVLVILGIVSRQATFIANHIASTKNHPDPGEKL
jgi:hypothetical protein